MSEYYPFGDDDSADVRSVPDPLDADPGLGCALVFVVAFGLAVLAVVVTTLFIAIAITCGD